MSLPKDKFPTYFNTVKIQSYQETTVVRGAAPRRYVVVIHLNLAITDTLQSQLDCVEPNWDLDCDRI